MYLFVTGSSITDLEKQEASEPSVSKPQPHSRSYTQSYEEFEGSQRGYSMAAEPEPDEK
jgi:hypothetical protein